MALFISSITVILTFVSFAAIVYPFKPYGRRRRALAATLVFAFVAGLLAPQESVTDIASASASGAISQPASNTSLVAPNGVAGSGQVATPAALNSEAQLALPTSPSPSEISVVRETFENLNWSQTAFQFRRFRNLSYDDQELAAEIEAKALAQVRPLPVSDFEGNLAGYRLLAAIRPNNSNYSAKVADYEGRIVAARQSAISVLRRDEDRIAGITWYKHPNQPRYINSRSTAYFYIGRRGTTSNPFLRMQVQYTGSNWLFVGKVTAFYDGVSKTLPLGRFERDNNSSIWEWVDISPDQYQIETMRSLGNAREAILRFEGAQYRKDVTLSSGDKRAIREVLLAYDVMRGVN